MLLPGPSRRQRRCQIGVNFLHQNQNRIPIYCVNFLDRVPEYFIFYEFHYVSLLVTISVKPDIFFNIASDLFTITICLYYDCQ